MRILVLGGTHFVGRHFTLRALERGHHVTLFNRGRSDPAAFPEVEQLRGDRNGDYDALHGRTWDVVVDPSAFLPRVVQETCAALSRSVDMYLFVSTTGVYPFGGGAAPRDEESPVAPLVHPASEDVHRLGDYGALKADCERVIESAMPGRLFVLRPGFMAGPDDLTDRFTYWPRRIAAGGSVILPGPPERTIQVIDVRDITAWALTMVEAGETGTYNAAGDPVALGAVFDACREATGGDAQPVWVTDDFLTRHGVKEFTELPLWILPEHHVTISIKRALARGLTSRPLVATARDTFSWDAARPRPVPRGPVGTRYIVETMTPERELQLLAAWRAGGAQAPTNDADVAAAGVQA